MSTIDEAATAGQDPPWRRLEAWLQDHARHFGYLADHLPPRRYGRALPQDLRVEPAPADPHQVVVFGPDGAAVHPVRGWVHAPAAGAVPATRMCPAVLDRVRQVLWVPEAHGQIVLLLDPAADDRDQADDVGRLLAHLEAVDQQRRTEQAERWLAPIRQELLRHPLLSQRLQWITLVLAVLGAGYLLFLPGPGKPAVFWAVVLVGSIALH